MNYEKQKQEIKEEIKKREQEIEQLKDKRIKLSNECEDKVKPFQDKIDAIEKPYYEKLKDNERSRDIVNSLIDDMNKKIHKLDCNEKLEESKKIGKHNIVSFTALLEKHDLDTGGAYGWNSESIIEKKALKNGIQIFRVQEEGSGGWSMWFAFKGLDLVGVSQRRHGEHRGDTTYPTSFIGSLDKKKELLVKKENHWGNIEDDCATFTDWKKELDRSDIILKLKVIKMTKENVKRLVEIQEG